VMDLGRTVDGRTGAASDYRFMRSPSGIRPEA
jgi:hypothetical protein